MKIEFKNIGLSSKQERDVEKLLSPFQNVGLELEDIWEMIDQVWDEYGCDNKKPDWDKISEFYKHPVWTLNGLFVEQHPLSMQHRQAISDWVILNQKKIGLQKILDYGGGFGTLAKLIAQKNSNIQIDIFEPYPSELAQEATAEFPNIRFVNSLKGIYDCLISTDVLEHVPDTLKTFSEMISSVGLNGYLIIANNFHPVIKCHLPSSFHFRYSFQIFAKVMGLSILGPCMGSHAIIYKKNAQPLNWNKIRFYEKLSRVSFPVLKLAQLGYRVIK